VSSDICNAYLSTLHSVATQTIFSNNEGDVLALSDAVASVEDIFKHSIAGGGKLMFVGNGGSAGIASHVAIDYSKNGKMRAMALNDGAALTCLANDYGYEYVFSEQIKIFGKPGDVLVAISSSGASQNIINAVIAATDSGMEIVTLSGFKPDNPLRSSGAINFYVPSMEYGFVEIIHLTLIHMVLDICMGWRSE